MGARMTRTMAVRNPDTLEAVVLLDGDEVPGWAADLIGADNTDGGKGKKAAPKEPTGSTPPPGSDKLYAGMKPEELAAEAEERKLTVEGTGANGNVLKGDLVAALEADDATKAGA